MIRLGLWVYLAALITLALATGSPSSWLLCSLTYPYLCGRWFFWILPYLLGSHETPGSSYIFSVLVLESVILRQYWEMVLEAKTWMLGVLTATGVSLLLGPFSYERKKTYVCILTCDYHLWTSICRTFGPQWMANAISMATSELLLHSTDSFMYSFIP